MEKTMKNVQVEKVIRDGNVAVLVSPGYGAGWSTWSSSFSEFLIFDRRLVELAEKKADEAAVKQVLEEQFGDAYIHTSGWRDIRIEWVPVGTMFRITEYDGNESIEINNDVKWHSA